MSVMFLARRLLMAAADFEAMEFATPGVAIIVAFGNCWATVANPR